MVNAQVLGDRTPAPGDYSHLAYCKRVVTESMRLFPPAWILLDDLRQTGEDGMARYTDGLWNVTGGTQGFEEYGRTRDLTDDEIAAGDPNSPN